MSARIPFGSMLVGGEAEASAALAAVGATPVRELTLTLSLPELGVVVRRFGVVRQLPPAGPVRQAVLAVLEHPSNAALRGSIHAGGALPVSRGLVEALAGTLARPVHLPWALRPLNVDLAGAMEDWADRARPTFKMFFSQHVDVDEDGVALRRVFSLPVRGSFEGTLHDPLSTEALDPDVGLVLEVDARS